MPSRNRVRSAEHARAGQGPTLRVLNSAGSTWDIDLSTPGGLRIKEAVRDYLDPGEQVVASSPVDTPTVDRASATSRAHEWADQVAAAVGRHLVLAAAANPGVTLLDPADLATRLAAGLPARHPLDELTGPFHDTAGLSTWFGVTRQALDARVHSGSLLMCPLEDGTRVYPAWQFRPDGTSIPHLTTILKILRPAAGSPWTVATWLRTPSPQWAGLDAASWLTDGRDPAPVITLAEHDAARWMR